MYQPRPRLEEHTNLRKSTVPFSVPFTKRIHTYFCHNCAPSLASPVRIWRSRLATLGPAPAAPPWNPLFASKKRCLFKKVSAGFCGAQHSLLRHEVSPSWPAVLCKTRPAEPSKNLLRLQLRIVGAPSVTPCSYFRFFAGNQRMVAHALSQRMSMVKQGPATEPTRS